MTTVTAVTPRLLLRLVCSAGLAMVAGLEFHRVFGWSPVLAGVVGAAALATAIPLAFQWRRPRSVALTVVVSVVAAFAFIGVVAFGAAPTPSTMHDIVDGFVNGWSRILTLSLPAPDRADLLVLPFAVAWLAALAGAEITLRSRHALLAVLPATVAYVVALFFGVGSVGGHVASAATFAGLAMGTVVLAESDANRRQRSDDERSSTARLPTVIFVVAVVLIAAVVGPHVPGASASDPYDPRDDRKPETDELTVTNPLALLPAWADDSDVLFEVRAATPSRWRLAALDRYDGSDWTAMTELAAAGAELPSDLGVTASGHRELSQEMTIRHLRGPLLPAAPQPTQVEGIDVLFDPATGELAATSGIHSGTRYEVTSTLGGADCTTATAATIAATQTGPPRTASTGQYLDGIAELSQQITAGATSPCERAHRIADYLGSHGQLRPDAPPGSFLNVIHAFLHPKDGQVIAGTSEQFATAFALLARQAGLPTRVAVGFHAGEKTPNDVWSVRGTDAFAWPEVEFERIGWVAFDPAPTEVGEPVPADVAHQEAEQRQAGGGQSGSSSTPPVVEKRARTDTSSDDTTARWWPVAAVVTAVLLAAVVLIALARLGRSRRRRRRRDGDVRARIVGAWRESLDALTERSVSPDRSRTAAQWVEAGRAVLNGATEAELAPLARLANEALFSPVQPGDDDAVRAWEHADHIATAARAGMSRRERAQTLFDPRPFFRR